MGTGRGSERQKRLRGIVAMLPSDPANQVSEAMGVAALAAIENGLGDEKAVDLMRKTLGALREDGVGGDVH